MNDTDLLAGVARIAHAAGARLLAVFDPQARPVDRQAMFAAGKRNEAVALQGLQEALQALHPQAQWLQEAQETQALPPGEWWVVDAVEGNVNHVHGHPDWCITITLVRDQVPVLTVVRQPVGDLTYTARRGGGAWVNGQRLQVSAKQKLDAALVTTGQAEADQHDTFQRMGTALTAMLHSALLVRVEVPSTFPLLKLAAGHNDIFWQEAPVLPGVAPGVLLVTEAGGVVTRMDGSPWAPGAPDILLSAPGLHGAAVAVLNGRTP